MNLLLCLLVLCGLAVVAFGTNHALTALNVGKQAYIGAFLAGVFGTLAGSVMIAAGAICLLIGYPPPY